MKFDGHMHSAEGGKVCSITLPCDQREFWVDAGYWTIVCVSDS